MSTIFKSGLYSTFSNSTIMNKNKQVSHSKETIRVIFTHPSPNLSASQNIVCVKAKLLEPRVFFVFFVRVYL